MSSKAEDRLKVLWLKQNTSGHVRLSDSPSVSCAESPLDRSGLENSVASGPTSPSAALRSLRCRNCERLFSKMRGQGPLRKKHRNVNPASLSCDVWRLNKTWQPRRWHKSRGRLWGHLKRIRLRAAKRLDDGEADEAWSLCSRPHVFLQRNLRLCKSKPKRKAKPARRRAKPVQPPHSAHRRKKRKSSENEDTSEHLLSSSTLEDELPVNHGAHHEALEKVPKKRSSSPASGFVDIRDNHGGLEGTRRVLKFDTSPNGVLTRTGHGGGSDFRVKPAQSGDVPGEGSNAFRTPVDHFEAESKIVRKSSTSGAGKDSFRNMLLAVARAQNQIIKESHH